MTLTSQSTEPQSLVTSPERPSSAGDVSVVNLTQDWARQHLARAIPGAFWNPDTNWWELRGTVTPHDAAIALRVFPELSRSYPHLEVLRDQLLHDSRPFDNATPFNRPLVLSGDWPFPLYDFQGLDLGYVADVMRTHGGAYIGWERGLGKTLGATALIRELDAKRVLIVAPNTAKDSVWRQQLLEFVPELEPDLMVLPNVKAKRDRMLSLIGPGSEQILIVHYEALAILEKDGFWKRAGDWDLVICDEAHRIKNTKAQMTKALKKIKSRYRLALSGSIVMNHAEELFSPLQWLFPDRYRAKWRDWNDRYLEYVETGGYGKICVGILPGREDALRRELGVFMVYRRKSDELDLPAKTEQTLLLDLSTKQRKAYDEILAQFWTILDDGTVIKTDNVLAQLTKLRQIATGLDVDGADVLDSTKIDVALDMIRDNEDEAFVVFTWYKANAHAMARELGEDAFLVTGDVPQQKRAEMIARFQAGEKRVFIGTLATLSESVNLQRASNAIFLDRHWNPATNVQAADRIYRIGQSRPVTITHLVAKDTVDELRVLPALASKEALRRAIFGGE